MYLVSTPPAHDRRREVLGHASHRVSHLRRRHRKSKRQVTTEARACVRSPEAGAEHALLLRWRQSASTDPPNESKLTENDRCCLTDLLGHDGAVGVLNDRRQGAVVVKEHHDLLPLGGGQHRLELGQCRRVLLLRTRVRSGQVRRRRANTTEAQQARHKIE